MSIIKDLMNAAAFISLPASVYVLTANAACLIAATIIVIYFYFQIKYTEQKYKDTVQKIKLQQDFFINILTHDLKTPTLAQLRGLELIQSNNINDIEKDELVLQIKDSCRHVLEMISKVLRIYIIENIFPVDSYESINIEEILLESFKQADDDAKVKNIEFIYLASGIDATVKAMKNDIKFVISNLLSNAVMYSYPEEKIFVKFERFQNRIKLEIISKGIILSEKECQNMFNISSYNSPQYSIIGHGINLYLCKIITDCYKGKIYADTDGEIYNRFTLELPATNYSEEISAAPVLVSY